MQRYKQKAIEDAFHTWRRNGQNVEATMRDLKKQGYLGISKPTLYAWMERFSWKDRAARADIEEQKVSDVQLSFEEKMLSDLLKQKEKYERYFESITGIDNQAQFAYANIIKTIIELSRKIKPDEKKKDPEEMKRMAEEILEAEYGIKR